MKLLSFKHDGKNYFGGLKNRGIVNLTKRAKDIDDLRDAIRMDRIAYLTQLVADSDSDYSLEEIQFVPTIPNPEKIICIGVNYANRNAEYKDGSDLPKYPSVFMRHRESLVGHQQHIMNPPESDQLDYEGEIVLIIGKEGRRIDESNAHLHIAGMTIMNEGSVRDYLRHAKFNVTQGKNFESSGSLGPWMVPTEEVDPMGQLQVITRVNGEERQNDFTENLMFPFRFLISYLSTFYRLKPGDLIATGTPNGAGARFNPPKYLRQGDSVEVEVPGIGVLKNEIVDEID
jgi:2-keto-4-pentenoate hydratase/2-oxohepta-3-ene-1,7-dioic acid hydratase in catechol pathway